MAIDIPVPQFDPNPILSSMARQNAVSKSGAEAQFAPYTEYANALSKIAFGQTAPANAIAQILSSPAAANMDRTLYNQLAQKGNDYLKNFNTSFLPNPQGTGNIFGGGILGNIISALTNKVFPQLNPIASNNLTQQANASVQQPGQNQNVSAGSPGYNTQFSQQSTGNKVPDSMGANNPTNVNAANAAAMNTTATGQAQNQNELQKQRSASISATSQTATQALKSLEAFNRNYGKSSYKGQFLGNRAEEIPSPPGGNISPEQLANRYANQYLTDLTGLGDTPAGKTDEGRSLIAAGKPDLSLDKDAQKEIYESNKAKLHRIINSRDFANDFYRKNPGATDEELVAMMNAYNRYAPSYDYENGKSLSKNDSKFKDFTSPEALQSYRENGDYNPYENKEINKTPNDNKVEKIFDLTGFKNDHDFNLWFHKQNKATKEQVKKQLKAGVY